MNTYHLIGYFGPENRPGPDTTSETKAALLDMLNPTGHLDHGLRSALQQAHKLGLVPTPAAFDLLVLATMVFAADTRIARRTEAQDSWTRKIQLSVPVASPERWANHTELLAKLLNFLTGDLWMLTFRQRPNLVSDWLAASLPLSTPHYDTVSLFSGGLDSLIGAIDQLETGQDPLLVSQHGDGPTSKAQGACFDYLENHYSNRKFSQFKVWLRFRHGIFPGVEGENTTRGRSFYFFALAAFAGSGLVHEFIIRVPENGLISLNVPLDPLRLGSLSTRTTHPFYLKLWNELLVGLDVPGRLENPYQFCTKGEMAAECQNQQLLQEIISLSMSCAAPGKARYLGKSPEHCGYCVPCLIRRAALHTALGPNQDPTEYSFPDLRDEALKPKTKGQQLRSFRLATRRTHQKPGLADLLVLKPGPLEADLATRQAFADVYRRGMEEVYHLVHTD